MLSKRNLKIIFSQNFVKCVSLVSKSFLKSVFKNRFIMEPQLLSWVLQRSKHFEIGGDKKGKGTSLF